MTAKYQSMAEVEAVVAKLTKELLLAIADKLGRQAERGMMTDDEDDLQYRCALGDVVDAIQEAVRDLASPLSKGPPA